MIPEPGNGVVPNANYELIPASEYYKNIDFEMDGASLKTDLNNLISDMTKISYGEDTNIMLYNDESIDKPGYMYGFL